MKALVHGLRVFARKVLWIIVLTIAATAAIEVFVDAKEGDEVVRSMLTSMSFLLIILGVSISPLGRISREKQEKDYEAAKRKTREALRPAKLAAGGWTLLKLVPVLALNGFTSFIVGLVAMGYAITANYSTAFILLGVCFVCAVAGSMRRQSAAEKELGRALDADEIKERSKSNFGDQAVVFWNACVLVVICSAWFYEPESPAEAAAREARLAEDSKRMDAFARNREAVAASIDERVYDRVGFFGVDVFNSVEKAAGVDCGIAPYGGAYHLRSKFQREQLGEEAKVLVQCGNTGAIYIVFVQHDGRHRVIRNRIN